MALVQSVAIISAGPMGRSIAHACALGGFHTTLRDILPSTLRRAEGEIRSHLDHAVATGELSSVDAHQTMTRISYATSLEEAARVANVVIEAVPEEFDSKEEIFRLLDRICRPETYLVTNTMESTVTDLARITCRATRIVGMRFRLPVVAMKQIEVVRGHQTSDDTLAAALEIAAGLKIPATVIQETAPASF